MSVPRTLVDPTPMADIELSLLAGAWPPGLSGEVFIATADQRSARGGHAFYGDGVLVRMSLDPGTWGATADRWAWRPALIDSPSVRLRSGAPDAFAPTAVGSSSPFGMSNASNTCPIPWGDRLFVTWDAGRPVEVDPVTLRWLGDVGHRDDWAPVIDHPVLPLITSSAHPVIDPDRDCLWTVTHNPITTEMSVVRYDGDGSHVRRWPIAGGHIPQSMHTISQTREWLLIVDCAFKPDPNEIFGLGPRGVTTNTTGPAFLIRKADLDAAPNGSPVACRPFSLGPETMHFHAAYDDSDGIEVVIERTNETDLAFWLQPDDVDANGDRVDPRLVGIYNHPMSAGGHGLVRFDPETAQITELAVLEDPTRWWATQLSAVDWSPAGCAVPTRHHQVFSGWKPELTIERALALYEREGRIDRSSLPRDEQPGTLVSVDRANLRPTGEWAFGLDDYPCSPCFVPRERAERDSGRGDAGGHDGWVIVPVLNDDRFRVEVFDAATPSGGPMAVLAAPVGTTVPILLHAAWMPAARPAPSLERLRFADDVDARIDALEPAHRALVADVVRQLSDELD